MKTQQASPPAAAGQSSWRQDVARYQHADPRRSLWQLADTLIPYFVLWTLMILSAGV